MTQLAELLERAAGDEGPSFSAADVHDRVRHRRRRRRFAGGALAAVVTLVTIAGIAAWLQADDDGDDVVVAEAEKPPPTSRPATPADVLGSDWVATSISPAPEQQLAILPRLTFADGHATARGVCNLFDTSWSALEGVVELDRPVSRPVFRCVRASDASEEFVFSVLYGDPSVAVTEGSVLSISDGRRTVKFERLSDLGSTPTADQLVGRWTNEDVALLVDAAGMELGGCDLGPWTIEAGRIQAPALPPLTCREDGGGLTELVQMQIHSAANLIISLDGDSLYFVNGRSIAVVLHRSS